MTQAINKPITQEEILLDKFRNLTTEQQQTILDFVEFMDSKKTKLPEKILESLALEAYRQGLMTSAQIQTMLKFSSRWQTEQFLKENQAYLDYTETDLAEDLATLNNLLLE